MATKDEWRAQRLRDAMADQDKFEDVAREHAIHGLHNASYDVYDPELARAETSFQTKLPAIVLWLIERLRRSEERIDALEAQLLEKDGGV